MTDMELEVVEQAYFEPTHITAMAKRLGTKPEKVAAAVKLLRQHHLVTMEPHSRVVRVTPTGKLWVESGKTREKP